MRLVACVIWLLFCAPAYALAWTHGNGAAACTTNGSDGFAGAPAGSAPFPTALAGYSTVPAWCVPGVGYNVGVPSGTVLSDPVPSGTIAAGLSAVGCSFNSGNNVITCTGSSCNNSTISGWDFALHNGVTLDIQCNGATIKNSNFKVGAPNIRNLLQIEASVNGITVTANTFDGSGLPTVPAGGLIVLNSFGTATFTYNLIKNAYYQLIEAGGSVSGSSTQIVKFNVIQDAGVGAPAARFTGSRSGSVLTVTAMTSGTIVLNAEVCDPNCQSGSGIGYITSFGTGTGGTGTYNINLSGTVTSRALGSGEAHGDWIQDITATGDVFTDVEINYNFLRQTNTAASTQGLSIFSAGGQSGGQANLEGVSNNVLLAPSGTNVNYPIIVDNTWLNGSAIVNANYVDITSVNVISWLFFGAFNGVTDGPFNGTMTSCTGNKNISTGATLTATGGGLVTCN